MASSRVKPPDRFSANSSVKFIPVTLVNVCTVLWLFVGSLHASSEGEMFWSCFMIQKLLAFIRVSFSVSDRQLF